MKQAMIFAAGLGTRLKPITDTLPKALVEVGGEPLLKRVILNLREAGFSRIVVNVYHFADKIIQYLNVNDNFGVDIRVSDERPELLETGGGIKHARHLFASNYPILIHNVDILSNVDLSRFYLLDPKVMCPDCGVPHQLAAATLLVSQRKTKRYLVFNPQMRLVGWTNIETGEVKSPFAWVKKELANPGSTPMRLRLLAFSGIHSVSPQLFPLMENYPDRFPIMDFYLRECDKVFIRGYEKSDLRLMDVGKLNTLHEAEAFAASLQHVNSVFSQSINNQTSQVSEISDALVTTTTE